MGDQVPGIDSFLELAGQVDLERFWDSDPEISGRPDSRHFGTTDPCRESANRSPLTGVRICAKQDHSRNNMIFEKMLVRNTALNQSDSMLLDKLPHQVMKIGNLLVRSGKSVINHQMNSGRVPD